jgi:hypothetical protein
MYLYNSDFLHQNDAPAVCAYYGTTLMNINNQDDLKFALSINQKDDSFWVFLARY